MSAEAVRGALDQVRSGAARIVYCSPERFDSGVFSDESAAPHRPARGRRGALRIPVGPRIPSQLPAPARDRRGARPAAVMACTATATKPVAAEIGARFGLRDPLQVRSGFDRPNLSFDVVRLEGKGSRARRMALLAAGLADPSSRPSIVYCGTRSDVEESPPRCATTDCAPSATTPGWPPTSATAAAAPVHGGRRGRHRRHQRVWDGRRQGRRAIGLALGDPEQPRGLLPGGRARGQRRDSGAGDPARDAAPTWAGWFASTNSAPATPTWRSRTSVRAGAPTMRSRPSSTRSGAGGGNCSTTSGTMRPAGR